MQSFIVNVSEDKINFFLQLMEQMNFEVLEIEEQDDEEEEEEAQNEKSKAKKKAAPELNDPFLDWEEERKNAKKNKY
jgi:hypothetical protein